MTTLTAALHGDAGMSTAEYALGTLAAVALATALYVVLSSDTMSGLLTTMIEGSLVLPA